LACGLLLTACSSTDKSDNQAASKGVREDGYFDAGAVLIMVPTADVKDVTLQETEG